MINVQDDDYDTVVRRFGTITGEAEAEWTTYRLAVVLNKIPSFVPRGAMTSSVSVSAIVAGGAGQEEEGDGEGRSVCDSESTNTNSNTNSNSNNSNGSNGNGACNGTNHNGHNQDKDRVKKTATVWEKILEKYRYNDALDYHKTKNMMNGQNFENRFPQLGIQRSVTAASSAEGLRWVVFARFCHFSILFCCCHCPPVLSFSVFLCLTLSSLILLHLTLSYFILLFSC